MSLFITSINSGSNGNCYYVGNENEAVLVDAGLTCAEIEKRMKRLSLPISNVKAIFVSHEHSDHIRGIPALSKKYNIPVFITPATYRHSKFHLPKQSVHTFSVNEAVTIGQLKIEAFIKKHDAVEPHSFTITNNTITVGVFTDIGTPCEQLTHYFGRCHAAFLESNYDNDLLDKGRYPYYLKNRIRGGDGHLSNTQALSVFTTHRPSFMSHLLLSHLSNENNCPQLVESLFTQHAGPTRIVVASRFKETPLYTIDGQMAVIKTAAVAVKNRPQQMTLF